MLRLALARGLLGRRSMSHRLPILFAALAAVISIGMLVQDACRSRASALPGADRADTPLHSSGRTGGRP
jgi:hypothetical protein